MIISDNLRGAIYMIMFAFTVNDAIMKELTETLPLFQTIALRGVIATSMLLVVAAVTGGLRLPAVRHDRILILFRSLADVLATVLFLTALKHMALATLSAVMQVTPLAVTLGAALYFKDPVGCTARQPSLLASVGVMLDRPSGDGGFRHLVNPRAVFGCHGGAARSFGA